MMAIKSQFIRLTGVALTLSFVLGALGMVWAGIIGLFLWAFLELSSVGGDQASLVLSSIQIDPLMIAFGSSQLGGLVAIHL